MQKNPCRVDDPLQNPIDRESYEDAVSLEDGIYPITTDDNTIISSDMVKHGSGTVEQVINAKAEIGIYTINNQSLAAGLNVIAIPNSAITLSDTCISVYTSYAQSDVRLLSWTFVKTSDQWLVCINNSASAINSVAVIVVYVKGN